MHTLVLCGAIVKEFKISVCCSKGLVYDGSDAYDGCIDLLIRAQIPLSAKIQLHEKLEKAMKRIADGQRVQTSHFGSDRYKTLGLALYEQITGGIR